MHSTSWCMSPMKAFKLQRLTTHLGRMQLNNQRSLCPRNAVATEEEGICSRYYYVSDDMPCIILLTAWKLTERSRIREKQLSAKHFCASFVRFTIINKSFVLNDPNFYFWFIIRLAACADVVWSFYVLWFHKMQISRGSEMMEFWREYLEFSLWWPWVGVF